MLSGRFFTNSNATKDKSIESTKMDCHDINVAIAPAKNDDRPVPPNAPIDQKLNAFCLSSPSKKSLTIEMVAGIIIAAEKPCTILPKSNKVTLPEIISIAAITAMHLWKKNTLLSIGVGSLLYILLVQFIFV